MLGGGGGGFRRRSTESDRGNAFRMNPTRTYPVERRLNSKLAVLSINPVPPVSRARGRRLGDQRSGSGKTRLGSYSINASRGIVSRYIGTKYLGRDALYLDCKTRLDCKTQGVSLPSRNRCMREDFDLLNSLALRTRIKMKILLKYGYGEIETVNDRRK